MRRLVLVAAVAGLLVVGCSKTEETTTGSSSTTTTAAAPATQAPATTPATSSTSKPKTSGTTDTTKKSTTTTKSKTTTTVEGTDMESAYCKQALEVSTTFAQGNEINPMDDPQAFSDFIGEAAKAAEELTDVAPSEIQADWKTIADEFGKLAAVPADQLFDGLTKMGNEVETAGNHIDQVTLEQCGFTMGGDSSSSSSSSSTGGDLSTTTEP